jgi:hypothetical protein
MPRKRMAQPRFDAETIRACGELLRFAIEPRPLPANALALRIAPSVDRRDVARTVRSAFDELSPRQREIVVRCEIRGEPYAAVAKSLHLSERHLYRERRAALSRIAHRLLTDEPANTGPAVRLTEVPPSRVGRLFSQMRCLRRRRQDNGMRFERLTLRFRSATIVVRRCV